MNTMTRNDPSNSSLGAPRGAGVHRGIWIGGGLMAVTIVALATALVVKSHDANGDTATPLMAAQTTPAATDPNAAPSTATAPVNESQTAAAAATQPATATAPAPTYATPAPRYAATTSQAPAYDGGTQSVANAPQPAVAPPERVAAAPVCHTCGVVESYSAQRVTGQVNGVGAVAGGVGGALIGSQIAGRGNHTLGGVLGAVGGGLLGNTIERHERAYTVYDAHVRMNDGTYRTIRESSVPQVGEHVVVEGRTMRPAR